ncbi:MAG: SPOR domain-containing protein [Candidatus Kapaibacterium sp.]
MADLNDDRKKEEEEYGGFEPDENDDESFMLEDENDYPAKLPEEFSDEPSSTVRVTASVESVDGAGESEPEQEEPIEEPEEIEEVEEIPSVEEAEEVEAEIEPEEPEDESIAEEEELDLDDDFKKKLQADIDKSKAKREANAATEEESINSESAKQIGDDADTVVMLSDIEADKPSNVKSAEEVPPPQIEENIPEVLEDEELEEKKKKKTPIWILMLYSSVATLIVTLGAVGLIWYLMSGGSDDHNADDRSKKEVAANHKEHKPKHKKKAVEVDTMTQEEKNWLDSVDISKKDTLLSYEEDKEFFAGLEDELNDEGQTKDKPKDKISEKQLPKKEKPKTVEPKKEVPKKKKEDIASNDVTKSVAPKEKKKSNTKIDESVFSMPQPNGPVPERGLFMVQIYSSPSREDAESWLGQLKARQVPNAMITEQEVKGRTWYRVRYGKFETKESARTSALELGYSQSWIDRVK